MAEWRGTIIPREVLEHRGRWVAIDAHVQPPRVVFVGDSRKEVVGWIRASGAAAAVMRVPTEGEPELVGAG